MKTIDKLEKEIEKDLYLHGIDTPFAREMINKYKSLGLLPLQEPITQPMPSDTDLENAAREYADKNGYGDYGLIYRTYLKGAMELRDKLQSLPVVPSEITEEEILKIIRTNKESHMTLKEGEVSSAKELYSLFKQSLPREDIDINTPFFGNSGAKTTFSCKHREEYQFIDKDGRLRCSDCHKVIE
jgi:hypothetical protein